MQDVGVNRTSLAIALVIVAACGPKPGPSGGGGGDSQMPAAVSAYAGLRWVPPDVTYAVATRRSEDAVLILKNLVDAAGILAEVDAAELSRESTRELGFDLLAPEAYADLGVDLERGVAIWSRGLGPSLAIPLVDPQRLAAELEARRGPGTVVQVSRAHEVDVYTLRPDRDAAIHWAIAGDWFLAHVEITDEREADGAWFESAWSARGGLAGAADFTAALDEGRARLGGEPPLVGLARLPALLALPLIEDPPACAPIVGALGRVFVAAGAGAEARGAIVVELPAGVDGVRALITNLPAGWVAARAGAPLQVEIGVDLRDVAAALGPCVGDDLFRNLELDQASGGRLFVHQIDIGRLEGKGAVVAELGNPRMLDDLLAEIPGIGFLSKKRKLAGFAVTDVNAPAVPRFSYTVAGSSTIVTVGTPIDALLGGGMVAGGDQLARVELSPRAWPAQTWDELLQSVIGRQETRTATVRRLRAWSHGLLTLTVEGRALVLTAHGAR